MYPGGITATTKTNLKVIIRYVAVFITVFWTMGLVVMLAVFSSAMNERKREFAAYRILGADRATLVGHYRQGIGDHRSYWRCDRCDLYLVGRVSVQRSDRQGTSIAVSADCVGKSGRY